MNKSRESVFKFKHFHVKNENSAMKVGTDGVLLGAWADFSSSQNILDIGTGTGLIALMAAQRSNATITGVEIDPNAANEAKENADASPWQNRISIINNDITHVVNDLGIFDHIVSNPPFFENGILAPDSSRATARHCNSLNFASLISIANSRLSRDGKLSFISPYENKENIIYNTTLYNLNISRYTEVFSNQKKTIPVRILWELTLLHIPTDKSKLYIRDINNQYTSEYINLTKEFYLNF
ncbi:MAG: methyltransferase [Muribaculaceae bacterium]|nr:methyltransferase [Muribaculaceae bacterium]